MKRRPLLIFALVALVACLTAIGCSPEQAATDGSASTASPITITVSAAASLQDTLEAVTLQFQAAYPQITVDYNFGSSGALQQQIEQGAPADVFFSAATKQMDALVEKDLIVPASRQNLVRNSLVLIAPQNSTLEITDLAQLKTAPINHFAVGEFRSVPAGQYAQQVFEKLGLLESLQSKFVFGNNVRSVLAAVESGNADVGMVYATDAALSQRVKVLMKAPEETHQAIIYPIAIVKSSANLEAAQTYIEFLTTDPAQKTFEEFGFGRV
jgi:molybdate transport system substrate-binding protein